MFEGHIKVCSECSRSWIDPIGADSDCPWCRLQEDDRRIGQLREMHRNIVKQNDELFDKLNLFFKLKGVELESTYAETIDKMIKQRQPEFFIDQDGGLYVRDENGEGLYCVPIGTWVNIRINPEKETNFEKVDGHEAAKHWAKVRGKIEGAPECLKEYIRHQDPCKKIHGHLGQIREYMIQIKQGREERSQVAERVLQEIGKIGNLVPTSKDLIDPDSNLYRVHL